MHQFRSATHIPQWVEDDVCNQPALTTLFSYTPPTHKWTHWVSDCAFDLQLVEWRATLRRVESLQVSTPHVTSQLDWPNLSVGNRVLKYYVLFLQEATLGHFWGTSLGSINWTRGDIYAVTPTTPCSQANASKNLLHYIEFEGFECFNA